MNRAAKYCPIRDYAVLGDGHTAALVSKDASVDWCCWPQFDSGAVFCRLLDARKGGWFRVGPAGRHSVHREYRGNTNVLVSAFEGRHGRWRLTDLMPIEERAGRRKGKDLAPSGRILRLAEGLEGTSTVEISFCPTFDFARADTEISVGRRGAVASARGNGERVSLALAGAADFRLEESGAAQARVELRAGERLWMAAVYGGGLEDAEAAAAHGDRDLERTLQFWERWAAQCAYDGAYREQVLRSALALKLLIFSPTGALVAAPTTSLPEGVGGARNWDYRYTWLRDSSLVLHALETLGYYDEAINFFEWLEDLDLHRRYDFQIMYTIDGKAELPERELDHLEGYRGSRPVRIGNAASDHMQLDIYGEVLDAARLSFRRMKRNLREETWRMLAHLADGAAANWRRRDRSIWEMRGRPRHFLYSKLLCWVALDRAISLAREMRLRAPRDHWSEAREDIRRAILERGYNQEIGAFTQAFDSDDLDASALAVSRFGFLPPTDPRMVSTVERIRERLTANGLVYRYLAGDSLPGKEGTFTLCTLWLVDNLAHQGRLEEAHRLFERVTGYASDLGLLSEEIDPGSGELLGNYPQGFTHLGLIRSACNLQEIGEATRGERRRHAG